MNKNVEDFIMSLRERIDFGTVFLKYDDAGGPLTAYTATQRYPGNGNRLARRSAAKGRRRGTVYEVTRPAATDEVAPRP